MNEKKILPVIPLRGVVLFPGHAVPFVVKHPDTVRAVEAATLADGRVFAVALRDEDEKTSRENLYSIGVVAKLGISKRGAGGTSMILQGEKRANAVKVFEENNYLKAQLAITEDLPPLDLRDPAFQALFKELRERAAELGRLYEIPDDVVRQVLDAGREPGPLVDQIAGFLELPVDEKQTLLETRGVEQRMRKVLVHIQEKIGILNAQKDIKSSVQEELGERQREMYLREQLKAIRKELGELDDGHDEVTDLRKRLAELSLPDPVQKEVDRELARLERSSQGSTEGQVIRNYLEWISELPWNSRSTDQLDINRASEILEEDHYGLEDVKDRILEFLAVRRLKAMDLAAEEALSDDSDRAAEEAGHAKSVAMAKGPILLFAGPPGVGKTSIAKSIARALDREYVRVALGGVRDEADVRGHRRTYVGAMPGRIAQGLKQAGTKNPVFLLDEIDKLGVSYQGDPASALMEVLDPAQNNSFVDHYLNVPFDLSEVLFIATANFTQNIPGPLRDRMEVVEFTGYTEQEKVNIAKGYLVPRQLEESGLDGRSVSIADDALRTIAASYTRESGVRQLEREIGRLMRKIARKLSLDEDADLRVTGDDLREMLGRPKVRQERAAEECEIGVATGMYYTPTGGDIMFVEASLRPLGRERSSPDSPGGGSSLGTVALILTGQLGDVMKESARAALTYATNHPTELGIPPEHLGPVEAHIHVPQGAIPKDGPSAGVTMATALASAMSYRPVRTDVAMTGEITLRGKVLPIGGIKEKVLGAHRAGIKHIILPYENEADIEDIPKEIREELTFHCVKTLEEVLELALLGETDPALSAQTILSAGGQPIWMGHTGIETS